MFTFPAVAADKGILTIPTTAVTGNPLGVGSDQMVIPISILNGRELSLKRENTLAETLNSIPGVSNSSFGPSVGRPMIRGMDSDRIKILQNGVNNLDASNPKKFEYAIEQLLIADPNFGNDIGEDIFEKIANYKTGNTSNFDWYTFTGITFSYLFGEPPCYCK